MINSKTTSEDSLHSGGDCCAQSRQKRWTVGRPLYTAHLLFSFLSAALITSSSGWENTDDIFERGWTIPHNMNTSNIVTLKSLIFWIPDLFVDYLKKRSISIFGVTICLSYKCSEIFFDFLLIFGGFPKEFVPKILCLTCWGWMSILGFSKLAFDNRWTTTDKQIRPVAAARQMLNRNGEHWRANLIESGHYCRQWAYLAQHPIKTGPFCVSSDS